MHLLYILYELLAPYKFLNQFYMLVNLNEQFVTYDKQLNQYAICIYSTPYIFLKKDS